MKICNSNIGGGGGGGVLFFGKEVVYIKVFDQEVCGVRQEVEREFYGRRKFVQEKFEELSYRYSL